MVRLRAVSPADGFSADADGLRLTDDEGQQSSEAGRSLEDAVTVEQRHRQIGKDGQRRSVEEKPRHAADEHQHKGTNDLRRKKKRRMKKEGKKEKKKKRRKKKICKKRLQIILRSTVNLTEYQRNKPNGRNAPLALINYLRLLTPEQHFQPKIKLLDCQDHGRDQGSIRTRDSVDVRSFFVSLMTYQMPLIIIISIDKKRENLRDNEEEEPT